MSAALVGKHIDAAVRLFGYPDGSAKVTGKIVYTWTHRATYTSNNFKGTKIDKDTGAVISIYEKETEDGVCVLKVITNLNEIIERWFMDGPAFACRYYYGQFDFDPNRRR